MALWLNWIEQPPPKGQVGGSNPPRVTKLLEQFCMQTYKPNITGLRYQATLFPY